jgi:hypothetical protein
MLRLKNDVTAPVSIMSIAPGIPFKIVTASHPAWMKCAGMVVQLVKTASSNIIVEIGGSGWWLTSDLEGTINVTRVWVIETSMPGLLKLKEASFNKLYVVSRSQGNLLVGDIVQRQLVGTLSLVQVMGSNQPTIPYHNGFDGVEVREVPAGAEFVYT